MGLYDDIDNEVLGSKTNTNNSASVGLFDEIDKEVLNTQPQSSFMDNIKGFGGKVKNAVSNMGISNPYEDIARQTLKGGIETNVFQPNQYGVTPLEGIGNIASDIGSGINKFAHAPLEFAKQLGRDTIETGKNIVHNPALLKDVPSAIMTGLKDLPFDVAQAVVDLPETIASSYNNRPFERQVNIPNSDEFAENMATNLLNIFLNEEQKRRNQELHQQRLQQIAQEREKLNQLPIAQTMGAFMLPASNIAKVAKTKGIADSIKTGAKWGLATTSGSVEDRTVGTLGGGAFGGTLHAGIKTVPKIAKGVKNVSAEIVDRLNPENYEQVIDSKLVKKGTGLSQRTVYEPEVRYEYKPKRNTYNMKDALGKERISGTKTDFTMGESGELKTPVRPTKKKYGVSTNVQYTPNFTIEKVAPSVFAKQQAKAEAKEEARQEQMENLAPNVMAEQEAKAEAKEQIKEIQQRGKHTKDFNKGDIIRDIHSGHIYEVIEPDKRGMGKLRDVDTDEIRTPNAHNNAHYEKYEHDTNDLIEVEEFKYDEKQKRRNAENYMYSKQEVVDAYNEYVKNPTEANKEKYEDVSGEALTEFHDNEEAIKNGTFKPHVENSEKVNTNVTENNKIFGYNADLRHKIINVGFSESDVNNLIDRLEKGQDLGKYGNFLNTIKDRLYSTDKEAFNSLEKLQNSFKEIRRSKPLEKSEKIVNNEIVEPTNGGKENVRPNGIQERSEKQRQTKTRADERGERTSGNDVSIRRENDSRVLSERGITKEHQARIQKNFKNQHELNQDIEDFINNKEYEVYNGNLPDEIKAYLKRYAGAGGLEKQGAEGKGLLSEYYTPDNIVKKMWELTSQYINTDGSKVLEPSVGIGRFLEHAPKGTSFDVVEMNPVSAKITELLYPEANVRVGQFQERFIDNNKNVPIKDVKPEYDIVIGNPPYGEYSGRFKGLGEGKKYKTLQAYFINRGLDTLKENGVMTFIVPSSFLDNIGDKIEISNKAEILDAYRLPENTFDTTSIGTDIIVMRKRTGQGQDLNFISKEWFKKHPEKILGTQEVRKNRFGKEETFIKGDKNAIDNIDTSNKDIKETETVIEEHPKAPKKQKTTRKSTKKAEENAIKGKVEYNEYKHKNPVSAEDMPLYTDTRVDGTLPKDKYTPNDKVNQYNGELYNDINYLQGDIYEKLDALKYEDISEKQKEIQRKKLEKVLPTPKTVNEISFNPTSDFIREYKTDIVKDVEEWGWYDGHWGSQKVSKEQTLDKLYKDYLDNLSAQERDNVPVYRMKEFVDGKEIRLDYKYSKYTLSEAEKKKERLAQRGRELAKIKKAVDKTFNDFVKNELSAEQQEKLAEAWNRNFNYSYTPDYKQMPMLVKGLNDTFYGKKLSLYDVQVEGINFLTNKGVGLLGFEVGVGKTLSGIISTVQNMQMGRCKRPLILVPNQVKDNWIKEINETFPNIKVNDVGNMSKFNGEIGDNTLTVATYEALGNIWYDEGVANRLINDLYQTGQNLNRESTKRGKETVKERAEKMLGNAEKGNKKLHLLENLGFDHITVDEAHNFKNLFGQAQADGKDGNTYVNIAGGAESARASRLFLLTQQILKNNGNRNVFMLTATPFNNSPLEVFNMLSFIAKDKLDKMGLYNVYQFMENYAEITSDWVVDSKNEVIEKQIVTGFKNAQSLREVIKSAMMIRSAEDAGIKRPEKHTKRVVLEPSQKQLELIAEAEEEALKGGKNDGAVLKALTKSKLATLSPDIATNNIEVSPEDFIKNSPKLDYCCEAIANLHKSDSKASQILYIPQGVDYLSKTIDYLVSKNVFKKNEIAIIKGGIKDDKLDSITSSFNNPDGDIKLIIGTGKIKEGMNLNKNSSTLYVPYLDWNPTDFVQVVGRIWRQGNAYKKVRVVVPLLKNSSDSFMFQKLSEKTDRINNIMDGDKDYIDTNELNTAEEKLNMISDPQKKARMFTRVEKQKLETEKSALEGRLDTVRTYQNNLNNIKRDIESNKRLVNEYQDMLKGLDKENSSYERYSNNVKYYKKELKEAEAKLTRIEKRISQLELDFEGKDAPEAIEKLIEAKQKEIDEVEELAKKKLIEYQKDYEKERATSKSIDDHIKDFENDTKELYGGENADIDIPEFMKDMNTNTIDSGTDIDLTPIYESISKGIKGEDLAKLLPNEIAEIIGKDAKNYTFGEMITKDSKKKGVHSGIKATIKLNLEAIGNNPYRFIEVLTHEVKHANQHKTYLQIMAKPKNTWTLEERIFIAHYNNSKRVNKTREKYYNKHKDLIDNFKKDNFYSEEERANAIFQLKDKERSIVLEYDKLFENYWNSFNEVEARAEGTKNAKGYRKESRISRLPKTKQVNTRLAEKGDLGSNSRDSIEQGEYSTEPSEYRQVEVPKRQDELKIENATRDSLYKWYGEVEKARFDVDKDLNHFNQITKSTAKDFSNKTGLKVSDKMVREILPFLRERTAVPEALGRKDLSDFYNKLSQADITRLTKLADNVCDKFDKYWQNYKDAKGILTEEDIENHISHLWKTDKKQKGVLTNYFNTNSRFAKPRTIESLVRGIEMGFEPRTLDIGEILKIQSDSLIKSANDSILAETLKKMRFDKEILIQPSSKAPADWVEIDHPALNKAVYQGKTQNDGVILSKQSVKVHPAVAEIIAPVFEVQKADNLWWKVYDNINGTLKQVQLGFSGFHGFALTESSIGNSGLKNTLKHLNPKKFVDAIKDGNYDIFKQERIAKDGIEHGLKLGTPSDLNRNNVEKFLGNIPFIGKLTEANNKILWDCLHNSFKIEAYKMKCEEAGENITTEQKRAIAQWVNDSFGGQAWELLGIKNSTVKGVSRALLSPDWLISTTRQFMGIAEDVPISKWIENCDIKALRRFAKLSGVSDIGDNLGVRGKSARSFWVKALVFSAIFYNLINAMFRYKDREEHPEYYSDNSLMSYTIWDNALPADSLSTKAMPYIFIGRNKDGSARYLRLGKQFREVPEMISEPVSKLSMKSATVPNAIANVGLGYSIGDIPKKLSGKDNDIYYNQEIWNGYGKFAKKKQGSELTKGMVKTAVKSVAPFVVNNALNEHHNMSAWDMFAQTSNGLGYTKAKKQYLSAYENGNKSKDFEKITQRGIQDGMSYKKLKSAQKKAKDEYTQNLINEYSSQYVNALKEQNQTKINKVADKLEKNNVPANIRVKVYKSALKEYRKSVK